MKILFPITDDKEKEEAPLFFYKLRHKVMRRRYKRKGKYFFILFHVHKGNSLFAYVE